MVKVDTATGSEDSAFVRLEGALVSFDCDRYWTNVELCFESISVILCHIYVRRHLECCSLFCGCIAFAIFRGVWIVCLSSESIIFEPREPSVHNASIAAMVFEESSIAINQFTFGIGHEFSSCSPVCSFNATGS